MSRPLRVTVLSVALTALAVSPAAIVTSFALGGAAFAKGGDGGGNGGGGGGGNGGGNGNGGGDGNGNGGAGKGGENAGGKANAGSAKSSGQDGTRAQKSRQNAQKAGKSENGQQVIVLEAPLDKGKGSVASQLKWMNAAHASLTAMANASPDSRVGQIATYRQALLDEQAAANDPAYRQQLDAYRAALAGFAAEGSTPESIDAALAAIQALDAGGADYTQEQIDAILAALNPDAFAEPAAPEDPVIVEGEAPVEAPVIVEAPATDPLAALRSALAGAVESDNALQDLGTATSDAFDVVTDGLVIEPGSDAWNEFHALLRLDQTLPGAELEVGQAAVIAP